VRYRGDVLDGTHLQAGRLERPDGGLPARAQIDTQVQEQLIVEYYSK
jgi:ribosomal protein S4